jgi:hypothetical protein
MIKCAALDETKNKKRITLQTSTTSPLRSCRNRKAAPVLDQRHGQVESQRIRRHPFWVGASAGMLPPVMNVTGGGLLPEGQTPAVARGKKSSLTRNPEPRLLL